MNLFVEICLYLILAGLAVLIFGGSLVLILGALRDVVSAWRRQ